MSVCACSTQKRQLKEGTRALVQAGCAQSRLQARDLRGLSSGQSQFQRESLAAQLLRLVHFPCESAQKHATPSIPCRRAHVLNTKTVIAARRERPLRERTVAEDDAGEVADCVRDGAALRAVGPGRGGHELPQQRLGVLSLERPRDGAEGAQRAEGVRVVWPLDFPVGVVGAAGGGLRLLRLTCGSEGCAGSGECASGGEQSRAAGQASGRGE